MKKTIAEQLQSVVSTFGFWRKVFDSKEGEIIFIRRTRTDGFTTSDTWEIRGSKQRLYAVPGTIPLYCTLVE